MKKYPLKTEMIKENHVRYTHKLEVDEPLPKVQALFYLFKHLVDQPLMLKCGSDFAPDINIHWTGEKWILTAVLEQQLDRTLDFMDDPDLDDDSRSTKDLFMGML